MDVYKLADEVTAGLEGMEVPLRVAVMGCVVNGPGEAREADLGVASGNGKGQIFVKGEVIKTVPESQIVETLIEEAMRIAEEMGEPVDGEALGPPPSRSADQGGTHRHGRLTRPAPTSRSADAAPSVAGGWTAAADATADRADCLRRHPRADGACDHAAWEAADHRPLGAVLARADAGGMAERSEPAVIAPSADGGGLVAWLENLSKDDVPRAGGKGANLGELTRAGLPVPPGFVVTSDAYLRAMEAGGVRAGLLDEVAAADVDDPSTLSRAATRLQDLVHSAG